MIPFAFHDGGRAEAGFKGRTSDCVVRAIAIAACKPYREVYDALYEGALSDRPLMAKLELRYGKNARNHASPRTGVFPQVYKRLLNTWGWNWTATMGIGTGCRVHLDADELPPGALIVSVSRHVVAVVDGVLYDTHDSSRSGSRCVYGYWSQEG